MFKIGDKIKLKKTHSYSDDPIIYEVLSIKESQHLLDENWITIRPLNYKDLTTWTSGVRESALESYIDFSSSISCGCSGFDLLHNGHKCGKKTL